MKEEPIAIVELREWEEGKPFTVITEKDRYLYYLRENQAITLNPDFIKSVVNKSKGLWNYGSEFPSKQFR